MRAWRAKYNNGAVCRSLDLLSWSQSVVLYFDLMLNVFRKTQGQVQPTLLYATKVSVHSMLMPSAHWPLVSTPQGPTSL